MKLDAFRGKRVVVTGHTGFKGSWLTRWLLDLGAEVIGIALDPPTRPSHFAASNLHREIQDVRLDIRDTDAVKSAIVQARPDYLFHLAAQAIVAKAYADPVESWTTNVLGTLNVLEGLRLLDRSCNAVVITSDKCYENVEWLWGYRETDAMGGADPYSATKGAAELLISSHVRSYFRPGEHVVRVASARAGNVIGGGDWAPNRIIPDCARAWSIGKSVELRKPHSTRPWQHVLEPLSGYLTLALVIAEQAELHGASFNFGPPSENNHSVLELVQLMSKHWTKVSWRDASCEFPWPHESNLLKLNCDKALSLLGWRAALDFEETVRFTAEWYRTFYEDESQVSGQTRSQIVEFTDIARSKGLTWAT